MSYTMRAMSEWRDRERQIAEWTGTDLFQSPEFRPRSYGGSK